MTDYEIGQWHCTVGIPAQDGMSEEYYRGYGDMYAQEQQFKGVN